MPPRPTQVQGWDLPVHMSHNSIIFLSTFTPLLCPLTFLRPLFLSPCSLSPPFCSLSPLFPPDVCSPGTHMCQQVCMPTNNRRSFRCLCLPGYLLNPDGTSCRGERLYINICSNNGKFVGEFISWISWFLKNCFICLFVYLFIYLSRKYYRLKASDEVFISHA